MLEKIIKELKDAENEAHKMIEDAKRKAQKMVQDEKNKQENSKNIMIDEWNQKGRDMVEDRVKKASEKSTEIYANSKKEKGEIRNDLKKKHDQAIEMILDRLVK